MIEQWFLDLDGVRSGPYQTPEVMSLIAEGEILPHHRISVGLREQPWVTILDWRLDQAKKTQKPQPAPSFEIKIELDETTQNQNLTSASDFVVHSLADQPESNEEDFEAEKSIETLSSEPVQVAKPSVPPPKTVPPVVAAKSIDSTEPTAPELKSGLEDPVPETKSPRESRRAKKDSEPKRDPMAEMYDMLQKTKKTRESKQSQAAASGISVEQDGHAKSSSGLVRTLMIGGGITLIGFALGQLFQQASPPAVKDVSSSSLSSKSAPPESAKHVEVIDRSTDKLTIRGMVERPASTPFATSVPTQAKQNAVKAPVRATATPESTPQTERELEELKNLKKELQELKNLKNSGADEEVDPSPEGDGLDGANPGAQGPNGNQIPAESYPSNSGQQPPNR